MNYYEKYRSLYPFASDAKIIDILAQKLDTLELEKSSRELNIKLIRDSYREVSKRDIIETTPQLQTFSFENANLGVTGLLIKAISFEAAARVLYEISGEEAKNYILIGVTK